MYKTVVSMFDIFTLKKLKIDSVPSVNIVNSKIKPHKIS